jgi:hypothetical protein
MLTVRDVFPEALAEEATLRDALIPAVRSLESGTRDAIAKYADID